jgi:hypothetical protein
VRFCAIHLGERAEKVGPSRKVEVLTDHDPHNREYQFADQACRDHTLIYFWLIEMVGDARPDWGTQVLRAMRDVIGRTGRVVVDLGGPNIAGDYLAYFFRGYEDLGLRLGPGKTMARWPLGAEAIQNQRDRHCNLAFSILVIPGAWSCRGRVPYVADVTSQPSILLFLRANHSGP